MRSLVRGTVVAGVLCCGIGQAVAAVEAGFGDGGAVLGSGAASDAAAGSGPVRVEVSADLPEPRTGDVVTYTVRVRNVSGTDFPHLTVFQLIPSGFHVTDTAPPATASDRNGPEWTADLPAGGTSVYSVTATAGSVADYEHTPTTARARSNQAAPDHTIVVTTACARAGSTGPSLACGSTKETLTDSGAAADGPTTWRPGVLAFGFAVVGVVFVRGRLKRRFGKKAQEVGSAH